MSTDPRTRYAGPEQQNPVEQQHPGQSDAMEPEPDYGESTYRGSGKLTGRRALITGGDSGIGGAVALAFAREGADVMISHLAAEENDARETCRLVSEAGRKAASLAGPVRPGREDQRLRDVLALQGRTAAPVRRLRDHQHDLRPGLRTIAEPARLREQQGSHPQLHQGIGPGARAQGHPRQRRRARPIWTPLIPATMPAEKIDEFGADTPSAAPGNPPNSHRRTCSSLPATPPTSPANASAPPAAAPSPDTPRAAPVQRDLDARPPRRATDRPLRPWHSWFGRSAPG
jgi:hypothetical protein